MRKTFFVLGCLLGFFAVASGALAGHILKPMLSAYHFNIFEIASRYHMYHSLALLICALSIQHWPGPWLQVAGWCFFTGTIVFSGSLYLLSLTELSWLGAITPVGGTLFMIGWLCLCIGVLRN